MRHANLPAPWADFKVEGGTSVTITTLSHLKENSFEGDPTEEGIFESDEGWIDVVVDLPEVTEEVAREWVTTINPSLHVDHISPSF